MIKKRKYMFLMFIFYIFISFSGCSSESKEISKLKNDKEHLQEQLSDLKDEKIDLVNKISKLNRQLGEGKSQYRAEDEIKVTTFIIIGVLVIVLSLGYIFYRSNKKETSLKNTHEKEKNELQNKNNELEKVVMELENTIKKLQQAIEEGERNEVSNLIKSLRAERQFKIKKIGGLDA